MQALLVPVSRTLQHQGASQHCGCGLVSIQYLRLPLVLITVSVVWNYGLLCNSVMVSVASLAT